MGPEYAEWRRQVEKLAADVAIMHTVLQNPQKAHEPHIKDPAEETDPACLL